MTGYELTEKMHDVQDALEKANTVSGDIWNSLFLQDKPQVEVYACEYERLLIIADIQNDYSVKAYKMLKALTDRLEAKEAIE